MKRTIEEKVGIAALDIYGLSEMMGPGVACEVLEDRGDLYVWEDHFYPEIVDKDTFDPLSDGEEGELVLTTLTKEALPIIRYRTKDLSTLYDGDLLNMRKMKRIKARTDDMMIIRGVNVFPSQIEEILLKIEAFSPYMRKMKRIKARTDDMMIIRGVNVFPSQIEEILLKIEAFSPYYQLVITRSGNMDDLTIDIEAELSASDTEITTAIKTLVHKVKSGIGVSIKVNVKGHGEVPRSQGKAQRVVDKRVL